MDTDTSGAIKRAAQNTADVAEKAVQQPWVKRLARFGFYAKGFLFIVIGALAIAVVLGLRGQLPDQRGALATLTQQTFGRAILIAFVIGAVGHGVWNLLRSAADVDDLGTKWWAVVVRGVQALVGFAYIGMAVSATEIVLNANADGLNGRAEETFVGAAFSIPGLGPGFIGLVGIGLIVAGVIEAYNGLSGRFRDHYKLWKISAGHLRIINALGYLSFVVRAAIMAVIGYLFLRAVFYDDSNTSIGIDAALFEFVSRPYGSILLLVGAAGLIAHGLLAFYEASYRRIS